MLYSVSIYSQGQLKVFQDWQSNAGSQNFLFKNRTKTDASNNIYVVGATMTGSGAYDILVAKYNPQGTQLWINQYNGTGNSNDFGTGVTIDASGNVYITGTTCTSALPTSADLIVIKYNSAGVQQWLQTYNGTGSNYDSGADIFQMTGTNVGIYITGSSYNASGNTDFITLKYSTAGVQQWVSRYNHTSNLNDAAVRIGVNATGVTIIGAVQTATTTYSCATVKYNAITGAQTGVTISTGGTSTITEVNDMVIDASNNIYITGTGVVAGQGNNYFTIKLNNLLVLQWQKIYNGASNLNDISKRIQVDVSGNVFVTGYSTITGQGRNMVTIKYNSAGTQQWAQTYNSPLNTDDEAYGIALDNTGNAYVTGYRSTAANQKDFYTIKYNTSGTSQWEIGTDGAMHLNDEATNIVIDNAGAIIVAGQSETASGVFEYLTVKYLEKNIITPTDFNSEVASSGYSYYENRGQLLNTSAVAVPSIRYYTNNCSPANYILNNSSSYVFERVDTSVTSTDTVARIDLAYTQVNANAKTYAMEEQSDFLNYYFSHLTNGVSKVYSNKRLVTTDLYPSVDLEYSSNQNGLKYYYIVKPGGNPLSIQLEFTGASSFTLNGTTNALTIASTIGSITFDRPTVYQLSATNTIIPIAGWTADWVVNGATNKYKFNIGAYDNTKPLIIQVDQGNTVSSATAAYKNLSWSTYYGGNDDEKFTDIVSDGVGDIYTSFETTSTNFPVSPGTASNPLGNNITGFVKFNKAGVRIYASYYGVTSTIQVPIIHVKLDVDSYGNTFLAGDVVRTSGVTTNIFFPPTPPAGAYVDATYGGGSTGGTEVFLTKFNTSGGLVWTTYYGSAGYEDFPDVNIDFTDDVYLSFYGSADSLLQKPGAYWDNTAGGTVIAKFTPALQRNWVTQIKGTFIRGAFDKVGNYFLAGGAGVGYPNLPWTNPGGSAYFDTTIVGTGADILIAKFTKNTSVLQWFTSIGGSAQESTESIAIDKNDNIYITGETQSTNFPFKYVGAGTFIDSTLNGTNDVFMLRFGSNYSHQWGSYFGGSSSADKGYDVATDPITGQVFFTGYTTSGITMFGSTPYYSQAYGGGTVDGYILAFTQGIAPVWGTYLGYLANDVGYSIVANDWNQLFLAGYTNSSQTGNFLNINPGGGAWFVNLYFAGDGDDCHISRFTIDPTNTIGINEQINPMAELAVYPNPSNGQFNYSFTSTEKTVFFKVYNTIGQMVVMEKAESNDGTYKGTIDMSESTNGIYFIVAETLGGRAVKKIIKQ